MESIGLILKGKITKKHDNDAGLDIYSDEDITIPSGSSLLISTGLFISIPDGHVGMLKSRSGLSVKHKIEVGAGIIDCGYSGEVKVHLYNHGDYDYWIEKGERIAQLLTIPVNLSRYELAPEIDTTSVNIDSRGINGFGSTGK